MSGARQFLDRMAPRQQTDWDIRGALNFIFGGAGGGLLAAAMLPALTGADVRPFVLLGLGLVAAGLFCVWLKIGRPWRAAYVVRRPSTSWMTREALLAPVLFACGGMAVLFPSVLIVCAAGALGVAFAYAQGRILKANIGIPAWRHWSCVAMIVATGLAEGFGLLCIAAPVWPGLRSAAIGLAVMLVARFIAWRNYRATISRGGAPDGTLKAFDAIDAGFVWIGHAAPLVLGVAAVSGAPIALAALAGALAAAAGVWFKYTLICRAAFTQGFALPRTPSRGRGTPGAGTKPGWERARS